ncbi:hypothetical protein KTJ34_01790 [Acinetobacter courvalinii]|uniref:baseplate hub protein n=1 Tax=Acinetobacter courvalinii TaxID=280147 RepID=UPI0021D2958C|nr:hypothetical protein [Acinetobacter courvalinii]MCU4576144.1 hypothetical protein [Acinetobacter courvalinii]
MSSFTKKRIDVHLTLANKVFNNQNDANRLELTGFRVVAEIKKAGMLSQGSKARIKIYGMKQDDMNALSILVWESMQVQKNKIDVFVGDENGLSQVVGGDITNAWADYSAAPEVCLVIDAIPVFYDRIKEAPPTSYPKGLDVAVAMKNIADQMGIQFKNNGVNIKLSSTYFGGTAMRQAENIARHADIMLIVDNNILTISPKGSPVDGEIPLISPSTGLIGYPAYHKNGISFNTLYNPAVKFNGLINLQDSLDIVKGEWIVTGLDYQLESEKPNGAWFCQIEAARFGNAITAK